MKAAPLPCTFAPRSAFKRAAASLALAFAFAAALTAALAFAAPCAAFAKSYECPQVNLTAQAQTDGALHVVEQRTFDFDGSFTAVWWTFRNLPSNAEVAVNSVRMATLDEAGNVAGDWTQLDPVSFQVSWRDEGGPAASAWSFDKVQNTVYAFFDASDARMVFELDYTVENGVQAYDDVAEVYWKYVAEDWEVDSANVTATIELPVPSGTSVTPGENVRAWGHGPADGTVSVNEDGTVTYRVSQVLSGQYAEARVVFPVSWLANLDGEARLAHMGTTRLDTVMKEEKTWSDQANNQRMIELELSIGIIIACVAALAVAVALFMRFGREHKPDFTGKYWRDVPHEGMQPAVVGRLWRWNRESADDLTATLLLLASKDAVRITAGTYPNRKGKLIADYCITRTEKAACVSDPLEAAALRFLFDEVGKGEAAVWLGAVRAFGTVKPQAYVEAMKEWQAVLSEETQKWDFFEPTSYKLRTAFFVTAAVFAIGGLLGAALTREVLVLAPTLPVAAAIGVLGNYMPRRTELGNNVVARAKALRNWLRDGGLAAANATGGAAAGGGASGAQADGGAAGAQASGAAAQAQADAATSDARAGELMAYAYLFGVADDAARALSAALPLERSGEGFAGAAYLPWYAWYMTGDGFSGNVGAQATQAGAHGRSGAPSLCDALSVSVGETLSGARTAVYNIEVSASSAGGAGGGFSAGGGGGFGTGGGAR